MTRRLLILALLLASAGVALVAGGLILAPLTDRVGLAMGLAWTGIIAVKMGFIMVIVRIMVHLRGSGGDAP